MNTRAVRKLGYPIDPRRWFRLMKAAREVADAVAWSVEDTGDLLELVERALAFYQRATRPLERAAAWVSAIDRCLACGVWGPVARTREDLPIALCRRCAGAAVDRFVEAHAELESELRAEGGMR